MARTPRNPIEASYCARTMRHLIRRLEAQGLTHRALNDALHFGPFHMGGDAAGSTVSRDKAGKRVKSVIDIDKCLRTVISSELLTAQPDPLSHDDQILFGSVEQLLGQGVTPPVDATALIEDQAVFEQWVRDRAKQQARERRILRTRVHALTKAADQLVQFLGTVKGHGHDGWDCKPELPETLTANYFSPTGLQLSWSERDALLWLLSAAQKSAAKISLQVSYWSGSHNNRERAGCFHPVPPDVPDHVLSKEMAELGILQDTHSSPNTADERSERS